jgi:hypothetical protein
MGTGQDAEKQQEEVKAGTQPKCTNHVAGPYWGAPCPNCGGPVEPEEIKGGDPMQKKRNA